MFLKHFELDISEYKGICINATEGGAYIEGTRVMRLKDAIDEFIGDKFYPEETIRSHLVIPNVEESLYQIETFEKETLKVTREFVEDVKDKYKRMLEEVIEFNRTVLKEILNRNEDRLKEEEIRTNTNMYERIVRLKTETMMNKIFYLYLMHVVQPYVINSEVELAACFDKYDNINFGFVEWVAKHEEWFKVMLALIEKCEARLDMAEEMVRRIKETLKPVC